ncbi:MAG: prenyltransferase/squalene oxidase repeat-containing protein, partial [Candidatus Heimdallarchaeota archaeon]
DFILNIEQPSFGFADSPGDNGDLSYTSMVIILSQILNNDSWINSDVSKFIEDSFSIQDSGFGYKPDASPRVKYTYYGIRALRARSNPLSQSSAIANFISKSRTLDGGFGQFPNAQLAYLSHTYWALSSLNLIGKLNSNNINVNDVLFWLSFLRKDNGTYGNSRLSDPSIISTYRALQVKTLLGANDQLDPVLNQNLSSYRLESGGYRNRLAKTVPTMEATYYGVQLALKLNLNVNLTKTVEFILDLQNNDGGFALRPGFSSRLTSTYFAMLSLKIIDQVVLGEGMPNEDSGELDVYAPIIIPSFIPRVDSNKTVQKYYKTTAKIYDPETNLNEVWVESIWYAQGNSTPQIMKYQGITLADNEEIYIFIIGPYREVGFLQFQIFAND